MKKKISKEKIFKIIKYVGIGFAVLTIVGFIGSLFGKDDGDGVRVPQRPTVETESFEESESSSGLVVKGVDTETGWGEIIRPNDGWTDNY